MNNVKKVLLALGASLAVAGGYLYVSSKKGAADEPLPDPLLPPTPVGPGLPPMPVQPGVNYDMKFNSADKAHVQIMQKMIGVLPDGAWGSKTEAALPKGLPRPFSLNQLKTAIDNIKLNSAKDSNLKKTGLKVGDRVYAAYTTDVDVTEGAKYKDLKWKTTGPSRKQEVSKGQYLGKIVVVNPYSVFILNDYNELVLATYNKISKTRSLSGLGGADLL